MNQNDMTQIKNAITMPPELADTLLRNCSAAQIKRFPYTHYSRLAMALIAAFLVIVTGTTSYAAYNVYQEKNLAVFMDASLSQAEIDHIGEELTQIPGITSCYFVSGEEAWEEFRTKYLDGVADAFSENPLKDSFNYRLSVSLNADTQAIRDKIKQMDGVRLVQNLSELKEERSQHSH
jgi:cell division protein FtsX